MEKNLIILRGMPSSGKSTVAKLFTINSNICTADDYHYVNDIYQYKPENASMAHFLCQMKCKYLMKNDIDKIVIANTNVSDYEIEPYVNLANEFNYKIHILIVENRHQSSNDHNVPLDIIFKMYVKFKIKLLSDDIYKKIHKKFKFKFLWIKIKNLFRL